jgi:hypothetical protein
MIWASVAFFTVLFLLGGRMYALLYKIFRVTAKIKHL